MPPCLAQLKDTEFNTRGRRDWGRPRPLCQEASPSGEVFTAEEPRWELCCHRTSTRVMCSWTGQEGLYVCVHTLECVPVYLCALRGEEASSRQAGGRPRAKRAAIVKGDSCTRAREASRAAEASPMCAER